MSFILDALRKSEHARQRQTGPGLAEVPVAPPRARSNVWATVAVALLLVNLVAVGVLLLRRAQNAESSSTAAAPATTTTPVAPGEPAAAPPVDPRLPVTQGAPPPAPLPVAAPRPVAPAATPDAGRNPLADEVGSAAAGLEPELAQRAAAVPAGPPAVAAQPARRGSVTYAPIPEAGEAPYAEPPAVSAVQPAAPAAMAPAPAEALPGADEVTARGGLPALHLDLHVYANAPAQRFIFVNSRKYREGDTLQEGPQVEQITPDGAVLNFRGSRFKLEN